MTPGGGPAPPAPGAPAALASRERRPTRPPPRRSTKKEPPPQRRRRAASLPRPPQRAGAPPAPGPRPRHAREPTEGPQALDTHEPGRERGAAPPGEELGQGPQAQMEADHVRGRGTLAEHPRGERGQAELASARAGKPDSLPGIGERRALVVQGEHADR